MRNYSEIKKMADYCLNCPTKPCVKACPLNNKIPEFIKCIKEDNIKEAYDILSETTVLPSICGRICPHHKQCMGSCVRGIKGNPVEIGELEAFVGDYAIENNFPIIKTIAHNTTLNYATSPTLASKTIAIIGGGPAGLTAAANFAKLGHLVTIFEQNSYLGGLLVHGIPEFRLSKKILNETIEKILDLGINVELNKKLGKDIFLDGLKNDFDFVILSFGANSSLKMDIPGEDLVGVFGANELLENNLHPDYSNKKVAVIGGGNVAMDAARTIKNLGATEVSIIYRRNEQNMPAEKKEILEAKEEGVNFLFNTNVAQIFGNDSNNSNNVVSQIECIKTELLESPDTKKLIVKNIPNTYFTLDVDFVVMAIGSTTDTVTINNSNLDTNTNSKGYLEINEYFNVADNIYAIGDLVGTKSSVSWASRTGRDIALQLGL